MGDASAMTRVKQAYPNVDAFWTEGGPDFDTPGYETDWADNRRFHFQTLDAYKRAIESCRY